MIVSANGEILGEGAHDGPGAPHAEVRALDTGAEIRGATMYVSLEPCAHHGRTPPCVDRLIAEGVGRVVIGALDPDPRVSGEGARQLMAAGVDVDLVSDPEARDVDPGYFWHREKGFPLVTMKYAMTLDGAVAAADGSSQWITSDAAREDAHRLRAEADAVVIGSGTLALDDPRLDVRLPQHDGHQPRPVVIAGAGELPATATVWDREPLIISSRAREVPSGDLVVVTGEDRPDPEASVVALADLGYLTILVEGGPTLAGAWARAGVVSRGVVYVGALLATGSGMSPIAGAFSSIAEARGVEIRGVRSIGPDVRIDFEIEE